VDETSRSAVERWARITILGKYVVTTATHSRTLGKGSCHVDHRVAGITSTCTRTRAYLLTSVVDDSLLGGAPHVHPKVPGQGPREANVPLSPLAPRSH
jgi:hypothetical protein